MEKATEFNCQLSTGKKKKAGEEDNRYEAESQSESMNWSVHSTNSSFRITVVIAYSRGHHTELMKEGHQHPAKKPARKITGVEGSAINLRGIKRISTSKRSGNKNV